MDADVWIFLSTLTLFLFSLSAKELFSGLKTLQLLQQQPLLKQEECPEVSILIAARNEENALEKAISSWLQQDYPNFEIIVVNDRSTDRTPEILEKFAQTHSRFRFLTLHELPPRWLGKNWALYNASLHARGEYYLFTDADILVSPEVLRRSLFYVKSQNLDHLCIFPRLVAPSSCLSIAMSLFLFYFVLFIKPWKAKDPKSSHSIGIGAFNLVKAQSYKTAGTHQAIALRPDDDLKLGKLLKNQGFRQDVLIGRDEISVEWYSSLTQLIQGLMKNTFAAIQYRFSLVLWGTFILFFLDFWPFLAIFLTSDTLQFFNSAIVLLLMILYGTVARRFALPYWHGFAYPLATLLYLYILWKSSLSTLLNQGIYWRDSFYSLEELRTQN